MFVPKQSTMLLPNWWQGLMVLLPAQLTPFSPSFQCCFKALALFCSRQALLLLVFKSYLSSLSPALQVWHVGFGLGVAKSADPSPSSILNPQKLQIEASFSVSHVFTSFTTASRCLFPLEAAGKPSSSSENTSNSLV